MNKQIALICLDRLQGAPYLDRTSGIVQVIKKVDVIQDSNLVITKSIPYTSFATHEECGKPEKQMIPNSRFMSCLYFEDGGIRANGRDRSAGIFISRLRLVCWLNTRRIAGEANPLLAGLIMADIIKRLTEYPVIFNSNPFTRIKIEIGNIPAQDASIFAPYDYKETDKQFLMMPYDFFALDLSINYQVPDSCLAEITGADFEYCPPKDAVTTETGGLIRDGNGNYIKVEA